jgi:hypothetical protein
MDEISHLDDLEDSARRLGRGQSEGNGESYQIRLYRKKDGSYVALFRIEDFGSRSACEAVYESPELVGAIKKLIASKGLFINSDTRKPSKIIFHGRLYAEALGNLLLSLPIKSIELENAN